MREGTLERVLRVSIGVVTLWVMVDQLTEGRLTEAMLSRLRALSHARRGSGPGPISTEEVLQEARAITKAAAEGSET